MSILKFVMAILWIIIVLCIALMLGMPPDLWSLARDVLQFIGDKIALILGALIVIAFLRRISGWIGTTETPNEPQKIVLFTKETPAQIVSAANEARRNIMLAFVITLAVFAIVVVQPFVPESLRHLDLLRTVGLTRINPNPPTTSEPQAASPVLSTLTPTPAVTPTALPALSLTPTPTVIVIPSATPNLKPSTMLSRTVYIIIITTAEP